MTARRKPVVAWAVILPSGPLLKLTSAGAEFERKFRCMRRDEVVKLVEVDPLARYDVAVMRAAIRVEQSSDLSIPERVRASLLLIKAIERREKARRKR